MIDEHREMAELKRKAFQQKVAIATNSHVKPKGIKEEDLVLQKAELEFRRPSHGVLRANWEGPYLVLKEVWLGVYKLGNTEGEVLNNSWH